MNQQNAKKRVIVTGGNGFIGRHIVRRLKAAGNYEIVIVDKETTGGTIPTMCGSFGDSAFMKSVLHEHDTVLHLACSTIPATSEKDRKSDIGDNIAGSVELLEACVEKRIARLIFISSGGSVYGMHGADGARENSPTNPVSSHGAMKLAIEKYIAVFRALYGLPYVIVRASNPYGWTFERKKNQGIIDVALRKALKNETITIWGDGSVVRDFIYIDDLTEALYKIVESDLTDEIINIGTGTGVSVNRVLSAIEQTIGRTLQKEYVPERGFDVSSNVLNVQKVLTKLGWSPATTIEEGIHKVYDAMMREGLP